MQDDLHNSVSSALMSVHSDSKLLMRRRVREVRSGFLHQSRFQYIQLHKCDGADEKEYFVPDRF